MSSLILAAAHIKGPHIDWAAIAPLVVLTVGALVVLLVGLAGSVVIRSRLVPALSLLTLAGAIGTEIWRLQKPPVTVIAGALRIDDFGLTINLVCAVAAVTAVVLSLRAVAPREAGHGEFHGLLLFSLLGMAVLVSAVDIVTLFLGLELLSIPLYVLCAAEYRREGSLESGLKYLIIGSVGSATLVYGLSMIYGATGQTGFSGISHVLGGMSGNNILGDPLLLSGIALVMVGFAFKASVAPFHQWTPDVYEGAPTPITAFMATATKAAAIAVLLRFFDVAVISEQNNWAPALAALATATILIGNVGALGQTSLKRLLGYSGVAQAGYMLCGVVVGTRLGVSATVLYVIAYLLMNMGAFAVIQHQEAATGDDQMSGLAGLGRRSPLLAWSITIAMLALAGVPGTVGFIGKFRLIDALVDGGYGWLAIVLVVGAMISLAYYLRVVAMVWMTPARASLPSPSGVAPIAGGSPEADKLPYPEVVAAGLVFAALTVVFGIIPQPLFNFAARAAASLTGLF
jgi:NADH-quinone oxidoreductase subunit N